MTLIKLVTEVWDSRENVGQEMALANELTLRMREKPGSVSDSEVRYCHNGLYNDPIDYIRKSLAKYVFFGERQETNPAISSIKPPRFVEGKFQVDEVKPNWGYYYIGDALSINSKIVLQYILDSVYTKEFSPEDEVRLKELLS